MQWDESYETGVPAIDCQHMEMFRQLDILLDRGNKNRIVDTLNFIAEYALKHFGTEEIMMKASHYHRFTEHKKLHEEFVDAYLCLKHDYETSEDETLTLMKLTRFVVDWLQHHIMGADKDFALYFRATAPFRKPDPCELSPTESR